MSATKVSLSLHLTGQCNVDVNLPASTETEYYIRFTKAEFCCKAFSDVNIAVFAFIWLLFNVCRGNNLGSLGRVTGLYFRIEGSSTSYVLCTMSLLAGLKALKLIWWQWHAHATKVTSYRLDMELIQESKLYKYYPAGEISIYCNISMPLPRKRMCTSLVTLRRVCVLVSFSCDQHFPCRRIRTVASPHNP